MYEYGRMGGNLGQSLIVMLFSFLSVWQFVNDATRVQNKQVDIDTDSPLVGATLTRSIFPPPPHTMDTEGAISSPIGQCVLVRTRPSLDTSTQPRGTPKALMSYYWNGWRDCSRAREWDAREWDPSNWDPVNW